MNVKLKHGSLANIAFVTKLCDNCQKLIQKALKHVNNNYHMEAFAEAADLKKNLRIGEVFRKESPTIKPQQKRNHNIFTSMVKTVVLWASNNIPLRGHDAALKNFIDLLEVQN